MENKRTMKFIGIDDWSQPVYKCQENGNLWKDLNLGRGVPDLHSCQNQFDGEPDQPIKKSLEVVFIDQYKENPFKFQYQMLGRLQSDCEYFLNYGNRCAKHLYYGEAKEHIQEMKKLYELLPEKPEWLSFEKILEYEKLMVND